MTADTFSAPNPVAGLVAPAFIYLLLLLLHLLLPAKCVDGYVKNPHTSKPYRYRINGLWVTLAALALWALVGAFDLIAWEWLYINRWWCLIGACITGLLYTFWVVLPAPSTGRGLFVDLFLGRLENVQYLHGRVDAKMFLYLAGAAMLVLNGWSYCAYHLIAFGSEYNPGIVLHAALLTFFVFDYMVFERVHLYTYDLFAERVGFKLGWGCLLFYPFFYPVGLWGTAHLPTPDIIDRAGMPWLCLATAIFLSGWLTARGANMQKYCFKRWPNRRFLGLLTPEVIGQGEATLLTSGFWGVARHINYLGEILMALGIALALGHLDNPWPWLYPFYYLALLVPRERDDDARCQAKYGALWTEYRQQVPARIIPRIY